MKCSLPLCSPLRIGEHSVHILNHQRLTSDERTSEIKRTKQNLNKTRHKTNFCQISWPRFQNNRVKCVSNVDHEPATHNERKN